MTHEITAYRVNSTKGWALEPADPRRDWMEQTPDKGAHRCLPLVMANQCGWVIKCPLRFKVEWSGKKTQDALTFKFFDEGLEGGIPIKSSFGLGIVSFIMPWLFRTSEGIGLMVRGPTNYSKDNIVPLDGLVETDWAPYTFTMNWRITKPKTPIWFAKDEPICMIIPYPIAILEQCKTRIAPIESEVELQQQYAEWTAIRQRQFKDATEAGSTAGLYKLDYVRGSRPDGTFAQAHWSKFKLDRFEPG